MEKTWLFDRPCTQNLTKVREASIEEFLRFVRQQVDLRNALDLGCGVGYFSNFLFDLGFNVVAVDGREANVREGERRFAHIKFLTANAEDLPLEEMGTFDFVLCVGLLYHLENPFQAIRNLNALTDKVLLVECMCVPDSHPTMDLLEEGVGEDQSLNYVAFYPSESCLVKMLYRAGFPFVYLFKQLPEDKLYTATIWRKRVRTMVAASRVPLTVPNLVLTKELKYANDPAAEPWATLMGKLRHAPIRLGRSLAIKLRGGIRSRPPADANSSSSV